MMLVTSADGLFTNEQRTNRTHQVWKVSRIAKQELQMVIKYFIVNKTFYKQLCSASYLLSSCYIYSY